MVTPHLPWKFHANRSSRFLVILLTKKQTKKERTKDTYIHTYILLLAPSITALQQLIHVCQKELQWLDLTINVNKSVCLRIGERWKTRCCDILTFDGCELQWANIRYLGVYMTSARVFTCSLDSAKRSFYRTFYNTILSCNFMSCIFSQPVADLVGKVLILWN